jgi:hypothetical protein
MSGQIFAVIWLVNNSQTLISIPFSGAYTPDAWGTAGNTPQDYPDYVTMPDGIPPRILCPGQTMVFGTKSDGGFLATSGTGGSLSIPLPTSETANMSRSVPWSYFNGLGGGASANKYISEPGFAPPQPFTIDGGATGCSPAGYAQSCSFVFVLGGGPPEGATAPSQLPPNMCMSVPTDSPVSPLHSGTHSVNSTGGSTSLTFQNGQLVLVDPSIDRIWSSHKYGAVAAQMRADGNFVVYNANADVIWQTNTSGHPGAYLSVDTGKASIQVFNPALGITQKLWSVSLTGFDSSYVDLALTLL